MIKCLFIQNKHVSHKIRGRPLGGYRESKHPADQPQRAANNEMAPLTGYRLPATCQLRKHRNPAARSSLSGNCYAPANATRPSLTVQRTLPCIVQPSKGVFFALDFDSVAR